MDEGGLNHRPLLCWNAFQPTASGNRAMSANTPTEWPPFNPTEARFGNVERSAGFVGVAVPTTLPTLGTIVRCYRRVGRLASRPKQLTFGKSRRPITFTPSEKGSRGKEFAVLCERASSVDWQLLPL